MLHPASLARAAAERRHPSRCQIRMPASRRGNANTVEADPMSGGPGRWRHSARRETAAEPPPGTESWHREAVAEHGRVRLVDDNDATLERTAAAEESVWEHEPAIVRD